MGSPTSPRGGALFVTGIGITLHHMDLRKTRKPDYVTKSLKERFFDYVERREGCWIWTGPAYGDPPKPRIWYLGQCYPARRLSLEFTGLVMTQSIRNQCGNPLCLNPEHLYSGKKPKPPKKPKKPRPPKKLRKPRLLSDDQIWQVMDLLQSGQFSKEEITEKFAVRVATIDSVLAGNSGRQALRAYMLSENYQPQVPGYFTQVEARIMSGLKTEQILELANKNGWEKYRIGLTFFFRSEDIESI